MLGIFLFVAEATFITFFLFPLFTLLSSSFTLFLFSFFPFILFFLAFPSPSWGCDRCVVLPVESSIWAGHGGRWR